MERHRPVIRGGKSGGDGWRQEQEEGYARREEKSDHGVTRAFYANGLFASGLPKPIVPVDIVKSPLKER